MRDDAIEKDGRWRPERDGPGRWIATRYVDHGPGMARRYERIRDGEWRQGYFVPNYHDLLAPAEARCNELNAK